MPKLPILKSKEIVKILEKNGFAQHRQKGSHLILVNENTNKQVVVPIHKGKDVKKGTLSSILRQADITL